MNNEALKQKLRYRDRIITAIDVEGMFRIALLRNTNSAQIAQSRHKLPILQAYLLAKVMGAASLSAAFLKGEERISIEIDGNGIIKKLFAEAIHIGEVRGYVNFSDNYVLDDVLNISEILGNGVLKVTRILYNKSEPIVGIVNLQKADISTDMAYYFAQSEQIPSAVLLDVDFMEDGNIDKSSGLIIQALPGASIKQIKEVYNLITKIKSLNQLVYNSEKLDEVLSNILPLETNVMKSSPIDFFCRCSKEKFIDKLSTLKLEEIKDLKYSGHTELVCHYCNEHYYLNDSDLDNLINEMTIKSN